MEDIEERVDDYLRGGGSERRVVIAGDGRARQITSEDELRGVHHERAIAAYGLSKSSTSFLPIARSLQYHQQEHCGK